MALLDPKYADMADLLSLVDEIAGRLGDIEDGIDDVDRGVGEIRAEVRERKHVGKRKHSGHDRNSGNRYRQGVLHAVHAVLNDLHDRASLIPVSDSEYDEDCTGCLLKKNGYPHLAELFTEATP